MEMRRATLKSAGSFLTEIIRKLREDMQKLAESVQVIVCTFDTVYGNTAEKKLL